MWISRRKYNELINENKSLKDRLEGEIQASKLYETSADMLEAYAKDYKRQNEKLVIRNRELKAYIYELIRNEKD